MVFLQCAVVLCWEFDRNSELKFVIVEIDTFKC